MSSSLVGILTAGAVGAAAAVVTGLYLRRVSYRLPEDEPRLPASRIWWAVPTLALVFAVITATHTTTPLLPADLVFAAAGMAVVWIDLDVHRIPTPLVAGAGAAVATTGWSGALLLGEPTRIWASLAAAAALVGFYFLMAFFGNLGLGDVRFGAVAGLLLGLHGWPAVLRGTTSTVVLGGLTGIVLLAARRGRNTDMAYGPAIVIGTLLAVVWTAA